jgi:hypothetical protein
MIIFSSNKDNVDIKITTHICEFHKQNPNKKNYAGCACSSSYALIRKAFKHHDGI